MSLFNNFTAMVRKMRKMRKKRDMHNVCACGGRETEREIEKKMKKK